jgi:hypothetical protein
MFMISPFSNRGPRDWQFQARNHCQFANLVESYEPMVYCAKTNKSGGKLLHKQIPVKFYFTTRRLEA